MSDAISISSPNGRASGRRAKAAKERLRVSLFGPDGLSGPGLPPQPSEAEALRRRAKEWRELAERGLMPRKHRRLADEAEAEALAIEQAEAEESRP